MSVRVVLYGLAALMITSAARAEPDRMPARQRAVAFAEKGYELYQEGRYQEALAWFREAEFTFHAPTIVLMIARSYEKLGKLGDAELNYERLVRERLPSDARQPLIDAQTEGRAELTTLAPRVPRLEIVVQGPGTLADSTVRIDGVVVPSERFAPRAGVNPGAHRVTVTPRGHEPVVRSVRLREGESQRIAVFIPEPEDPVILITPAIAMAVVGGIGLTAGIVGGAVAFQQQGELESRCPNRDCNPEHTVFRDRAFAAAHVSTAGFVLAGVATAISITLFALDESGEANAEIGLDGIFVRGAF